MKRVKVKLMLSDILFDVLNTTHRAGLAMEAADGNNYRAAAHVMASLDPEDELQIERSIANASARVKTEFGEYLTEVSIPTDGVTNRLASNFLDLEDGTVEYNYDMPSNFNSSAVEALTSGIHDYIVASVIADWYMTSNPGQVQAYQNQMVTAIENARRALYKRSRPKRPSYYISQAPGSSAGSGTQTLDPSTPQGEL